MLKNLAILNTVLLLLFCHKSTRLLAQDNQLSVHPSLIMTSAGVKEIRESLGKVELFDKALAEAQAKVDAAIDLGIKVPIPIDMAGGYTHQQHKRNFFTLQLAGNLYQITEKEKYAKYIKDNLMAYAKMYPNLPLHPTQKSYATGKIFWQCLNDANWLVYVSQAYDAIYNYLSKDERDYLEQDLFRPFADFLSLDNPQFFNRIHNHSTWANAAVGMIGLVMKDEALIDRALYGMPLSEERDLSKDNDGGYIYEKGMLKAGFLAQLDGSFAPDGYFTEGPYYLRYAIFPFLIFSKALDNNLPDLDIMNYRDGIMTKATFTLLNQTDPQGVFFPINDAQKGMSWKARELITAVDIMYHHDPSNKSLLDIARRQDNVLLDQTGYAVAAALGRGEDEPYVQSPMIYGDGKDGTEGGVAVLRNKETCLVMKYSAQGMGHGHFDKLSYSFYDDTGEVIQDYGSARWVNIDQKGGGRYLKENKTFAKQSIAHNTVVLNEQSHFKGKIRNAERHHPYLYFEDLNNRQTQIASALDTNAYPGSTLHRTMVLLTDEALPNPLMIDVFRVQSATASQVDLPLWFQGHLLDADFEYDRNLTSMQTLGKGHGYQHIWQEASGYSASDQAAITWLNKGKIYTSTFVANQDDELIFGKAGASDPNFNLRPDPVLILRKKSATESLFVSVVESHGTYDYVSETPLNPYADIKRIEVLTKDSQYSVLRISDVNENNWLIAISNKSADKNLKHKLVVQGETIQWTGPYSITNNLKQRK